MINLQPVTWDNYVAVYQLQVEEHQKGFLGPTYASLSEAYLELVDPMGIPFTMFDICNGDVVVGFAVIE